MNCCEKEGYCSFYKRELWGLTYRLAHGIDCSDADHEQMKKTLMESSVPKIEKAAKQTPSDKVTILEIKRELRITCLCHVSKKQIADATARILARRNRKQ